MRGLLCFLLLFALTVNMNARPQADTRITLKLDNVSLTKAMNEIKQQSRFLFINKGVDAGKIVSINVESETINNVCKALFTPVNVAFTIEGDNIIITNANVNDKKGGPVTITGTIRDAAGEPVPGAGVVESGTTNGTVTDLDGKYSLRVSDKGVTIEVNCLGYEPATFESAMQLFITQYFTRSPFHSKEQSLPPSVSEKRKNPFHTTSRRSAATSSMP